MENEKDLYPSSTTKLHVITLVGFGCFRFQAKETMVNVTTMVGSPLALSSCLGGGGGYSFQFLN